MRPHQQLPYDLAALRSRQADLARQVSLRPLPNPPATIAGVDVAIAGELIVAAAVLFSFPGLELLEQACVSARPTLPYIPGFLSFREGPALVAAVRRLQRRPELLIVDGQGRAHPQRFGLACHLGVELDLPALGCAKSRLLGDYAEPATTRGSCSELIDQDETIGFVVRTRSGVKPVFVSPGHLMTLEDAVQIVLATTSGYRLPEPQRAADRLAGACKQKVWKARPEP